MANALKNNYTLLHLGFAEYAAYFSESIVLFNQSGKSCIVDFETTSVKNRLRIKMAALLKKVNNIFKNNLPFVEEIHFLDYTDRYDLSTPLFLKIAQKKIGLVDGWLYIDKEAFITHAEIVRKVLKPNQCYIDNVERFFQKELATSDIIIGVHIRKGDYATYRNGAWFYSNEEYKSFIRQLMLLPSFDNKTITFLLCSNEEINTKDFEGVNFVLSTNHFIEDMYALSICDYIIGPPSTFSSWASFYGKTPLLHIDHARAIIKEDDFKIFESY